jgi:hypothetical protein
MYGDTPLGVVPYASLEEAGSQYDRDLQISGTAAVSLNVNYDDFLTVAATADFTTTYDGELFDTLQIDGTAAFAGVLNLSTQRTRTAAATAAFASSPLTSYVLSQNIDATASFFGTPYDIFFLGLQIQGTANFATSSVAGGVLSVIIAASAATTVALTGTFNHVNISGSAGVVATQVTGTFNHTRSLPVNSGFTFVVDGSWSDFLTIAGTANFFSPGGLVIFTNREIAATSGLTVVHQFGHGVFLDIDGTAATDEEFVYLLGDLLTIAGTANFAFASELNDFRSLSLPCLAYIFVENLYEFLYEINGTGAIGQTYTYNPVELNQPSASASISFANTKIANRTVEHDFLMTQEALCQKTTGIASSLFPMTQTVEDQRIRNRSVTQTLSLTQEGEVFRSIVQSITFTGSANGPRAFPKEVEHDFDMVSIAFRNIIVGRSISDDLLYNPPNYYDTPLTDFQYIRPTVEVRTVSRRCLVIFNVPGQTILLPCPEFGDTESPTGTIDVKRTMSGGTRVYKRQSQLNKLKYTFSLWTNKYLELRQFYINHCAKVMSMTNWKGELWYGYITNNPIEFDVESRYQPKGEKYSVTLEFEGVKT